MDIMVRQYFTHPAQALPIFSSSLDHSTLFMDQAPQVTADLLDLNQYPPSPPDIDKTLETNIIMPYNRDEVIASVTEFYEFLTTHLHFYPSEVKTPPPSGWPQITPKRFTFLQKSDTVINLLRHLPYLPGGNEADKWIYDHTSCLDYTEVTTEGGARFACPEYEEACPWEKQKDSSRQKHIVMLGMPITDAGCYIFLDTLDGEVAIWDVGEDGYASFDSAGEFYAWLKKQYEELRVFSAPGIDMPAHVYSLTHDRYGGFKEVVRSLGWPPGDGSKWNRQEGMKEVERVWRECR